jgi:arylsulfatase A-like enzyme
VLDVTPTLLTMLGIPVARDMDGEPMTEWLASELLERTPVRSVATHTGPDWFASRAKPTLDSQGSGERLKQLRALGYLDE